jgi:hypothetical protein
MEYCRIGRLLLCGKGGGEARVLPRIREAIL